MDEKEHDAYHRRLTYLLFLIVFILIGGAAFYHYIEGWRFLDALYFSTATMTTVGYGDIAPKTDAGKIFTIFYIFSSVSIVLYGLSTFASHFVEAQEETMRERQEYFKESINERRRKTKDTAKKIKNIFMFDNKKLIDEEK
jgi:voltage-gated potassium channel